jgi:hypothetical protein
MVSFATLAFTSAAVAASPPTFDPRHLSDDVKTLSSDAFEGRGPQRKRKGTIALGQSLPGAKVVTPH